MHQIMEWISSGTASLIESFGIFGIFIGMILESACIPFPSEVIMLSGGFLAQKGAFPVWEVVAAGVLGNVLGSVIIYILGVSGARALLERYGKYILIHPRHIVKAEGWFARYGEWAVFFGRNLPLIRTFISLPAAVSKMKFVRFFIFTFLGCLPWNAALTYIGFKLGQNWQLVEPYIRPVSYLALLIVILLIIKHILGAVRNKEEKRG